MPTSPTQSLESSSIANPLIDFDEKFVLHRVDSPHYPPVEDSSEDAEPASMAPPVNQQSEKNQESNEILPEAIRAAHADDLILHLQRWSEELDQRASRLHADMATHERRERAFRMWMQNRRNELEVQLEEARQAQSKAEAIARRLALSQG